MATWATVTVNDNGGSGSSPSVFYFHTTSPMGYYKSKSTGTSNILSRMTSIPTRKGYTYLGHKTGKTSGTEVIRSDGVVRSTTYPAVSSDFTIYANWTPSVFTLTFDPGSGTVSPTSKSVTYNTALGELPTPERSGYHFDGWHTAGVGGTLVTADTVYTWGSDTVVFAHWTKKPVLTFDPCEGEVSPTTKECWYGEAIGVLPRPTKSGYFFDGWFDSATGGNLVTAETTYDWQGDATIYAHWTEDEQYRITFDPQGGVSSGYEKVVRPGETVGELPTATLAKHVFGGWWTATTGGTEWTSETVFDRHSDITLYAHWTRTEYTITFDPRGGTASFLEKEVTVNEEVGELPTCEKYANGFLGWFDSATGGTEWTAETVFDRHSDITLYAQWDPDPAYARTLSLNANGGSVSPTSVSCTFGLEIGAIPVPVKAGKIFVGWFDTVEQTGGKQYEFSTVCDWSGTKTVYARWIDSVLGKVTDYFELASEELIPISSSNGDNKKRICVSHTGRYETNGNVNSGIWRNPTVTYRVIADTTVSVVLGRAFAKSGSVSGYFITSVAVVTEIGEFPTVTVSAHANEGANAINLFNVSIPVQAKAHAQNLLSSISGGGELQALTMVASCDPVVCAEDLMPCASDVVNGKYEVAAETLTPFGESAPTAANGFISLGEPKRENQGGVAVWTFKAVREIN